MKVLVSVFCLLAAAAALPSGRIVGGEDAEEGQIPYIASLRMSGGTFHFCGATIISKRSLLTAAHCKVTSLDDMTAVVGTTKLSSGGQSLKIAEFITHPSYDPMTITHDIAVVILAEDINLIDGLVEVRALSTGKPPAGTRLTTAGWGYTSYPGSAPDHLQWFVTQVMGTTQCHDYNGVLEGKICTLTVQNQGVCSGDSGGPLIREAACPTCDEQVVGVTSAAFLCALGLPDFFTDVAYYDEWILAHMQ